MKKMSNNKQHHEPSELSLMSEGIPDAGLPPIFSSSPFDLRQKKKITYFLSNIACHGDPIKSPKNKA
jgi:hypothetical protein